MNINGSELRADPAPALSSALPAGPRPPISLFLLALASAAALALLLLLALRFSAAEQGRRKLLSILKQRKRTPGGQPGARGRLSREEGRRGPSSRSGLEQPW